MLSHKSSLSHNLWFIFQLWYNYWEFFKATAKRFKIFPRMILSISLLLCWLMFVFREELMFKNLIAFGRWFMKLLLSWVHLVGGWVSSTQCSSWLVMHSSPSVFQACGSLVLLSCPRLSTKLLECLDRSSLAQPTSYETGQQELRLTFSPVHFIDLLSFASV